MRELEDTVIVGIELYKDEKFFYTHSYVVLETVEYLLWFIPYSVYYVTEKDKLGISWNKLPNNNRHTAVSHDGSVAPRYNAKYGLVRATVPLRLGDLK